MAKGEGVTPDAVPSGGNGDTTNRQSGGGTGTSSRSNQGRNRSANNRLSNLKGDVDELKNNVYVIGNPGQVDTYTKTTKAIIDYVARTTKFYPQDTCGLMRTKAEVRILLPVYPVDGAEVIADPVGQE